MADYRDYAAEEREDARKAQLAREMRERGFCTKCGCVIKEGFESQHIYRCH